MATGDFTTTPSNASDALFRAWGLAIETALTVSGGLIKTADTGQIDWDTVLAPTVVSTKKGYIILRFDDALQASAPVFIRMDFGSYTSSASNPAIWITVGTGSDGAGNITGVCFAETTMGGTAAASAISYYSVSTNRFLLFLWVGVTMTNIISLERSRNSAGTETSEAVMLIRYSKALGAWKNRYVLLSGVATIDYDGVSVSAPSSGNGISSPDINAYPIRFFKPNETCPSINILGYVSGDFTVNATYTITVWDGISRVYRSPTTLAYPTLIATIGANSIYPLMLME